MWFGNIKMPIRWRLSLLSTVGLIGILVLFHMFVYVALKNWLIHTEEAVLQSKLVSIKRVHEQKELSELPHSVWLPSLIEKGQAVRILIGGKTRGLVNKGISSHVFLREGQAVPKRVLTQMGKKSVLILTMPIEKGTGRIELYTDFSSTTKYVKMVLGVLIIASIALLLFVMMGGYLMSTIAFRPVTRITYAVQKFDPAQPTHRLEIPATGDEIALLSRVFNSLLDRIYASMQKQNQFVSDVSHELRTPIAVVRGYLDLLRRWGLSKPEVAEEALATMDQELGRVEKLTERLLRLARFELDEHAGELETFELTTVVWERVKRWRHVHRTLTLQYDEPGHEIAFTGLKADIEELLDILLDNAGKYTEAGGLIKVACARDKEWIEISVRDTGQGIPPEELPHVFERFYRAKKQIAQTGSGLGLSIAQKIVEKAQGKLEVKSKLGLGTKVIVRLPAQGGR
ncbi:sensor histidine kinase [Laceyella putida]|uniref:histidine kinase n=1 Tax=Laceyella putida TaxID=110101 RepID=A0ABW2RNM3_9BACL